ncbi:MAG: FMN-binding protein [Candidatus Omnitrophica bacterium]|nr:FMN-binding protein [Candidatus Omnitrophota bacterium]
MKKIIHILSVLTLVSLLSGACLVGVYKATAQKIVDNQKKATKDAIFKIFPEGKDSKQIDKKDLEIFSVTDAKQELLGYAFTCAGNGYQGEIKIMAGIEKDLNTLVGIEILESQETPGLGQEITNQPFKDEFKQLKTEPNIIYVKGEKPDQPNEIETITGATISSKAVVAILNKGIEKVRQEMGEK